MINLKIGENHKCQLPNSWDEITLKDYEKIYTLIKTNSEPTQEKENENAEKPLDQITAQDMERAMKNLQLNRAVFCALTGLDKEVVNKTNQQDMFTTLNLMSKFLNDDVESRADGKYIQHGFTYKNKRYFFPKEKMTESTFGDFIETSQLDMLAKKQEGGRFSVIAEQMAILCREEGEEYDDERVAKKARLFRDLKMDVIWEFVFFLTERISIWNKNIPTSLKKEIETLTDTQPQIGKS